MRWPSFLVVLTLTACTGFREVRPGVYRAPQATEDRMARRIEAHGIRSLLCLRGRGDGPAGSERAAYGTGIEFWSVPMSATRLPPPDTLLALWRAVTEAPRPLLIHCRAGVDRTGFASALVMLHETGDLDAARGQLALVPYGHVAMSRTGAMDEVLDRYEPWHGKLAFPDWVTDVYAADFAALPR
jgi:protein tyrosine phosphatase (PTP) superfamily phosphohydrolase (DUF442 family)